MSMYNLLKYSDNYAKLSGRLFQYSRDDLADGIKDPKTSNFTSGFID